MFFAVVAKMKMAMLESALNMFSFPKLGQLSESEGSHLCNMKPMVSHEVVKDEKRAFQFLYNRHTVTTHH